MTSRSTFWRRMWLTYVAVSVVVVAADFAYLRWRERSLEPLSVPVDLSRPGTHAFVASGFHSSRYHPEFSLEIPFKTDSMNWFPSYDYSELWAATPPVIELNVRDSAGRVVLQEKSALTRAEGWIVTGTHGVSWVEIYKFAEFRGRMFGSYRVNLTVLRGSNEAATYRPIFKIAAIKAYAVLGASLGFVALVGIVLVTGVVLAAIHFAAHRRRKRNFGYADLRV